jgi:hypothetical protein
MGKMKAVATSLFLGALLFAYECDCAVQGPSNSDVCMLDPDSNVFYVHTDNDGVGKFTPAEGHSCSDYKTCFSLLCDEFLN